MTRSNTFLAFEKQAFRLTMPNRARNLLQAVKSYLSGNSIAVLPEQIAKGKLDALGEEKAILRQQTSRLGKLFDRPYFHIKDRIAGGVAGAGAGFGLDTYLQNKVTGQTDGKKKLIPLFEKIRKNQRPGSSAERVITAYLDSNRLGKNNLRRLAATAAGGYVGGKGLNTANNVARRYIAETSPLFGYSMPKTAPKKIVKDLWRYGVRGDARSDIVDELRKALGNHPAAESLAGLRANDPKILKILQNSAEDLGNSYTNPRASMAARDYYASAARHELLRRYLGVHTDAVTDFFVRNPRTRAYEFNKKLFKPGSLVEQQLVTQPIQGQSYKFFDQIGPGVGYTERGGPFEALFGSHDMRRKSGLRWRLDSPDTKQRYLASDVWNFALDPNETDVGTYWRGLAKTSPQRWVEYLSQPAALTDESLKAVGSGQDIGGRLRSSTLRQVMEKVFRQHTPVIRQRLDMMYDSYGNVSPKLQHAV